VEPIVTVDFWVSPSSPGIVGLGERDSFVRDGEVDERCGSSCDSSLGAAIEVILGIGSHEGELHVSVSVDSSRNDHLSRAIDDLGSFVSQILRNCCYFSTFQKHV
jgi:hypothetical protein